MITLQAGHASDGAGSQQFRHPKPDAEPAQGLGEQFVRVSAGGIEGLSFRAGFPFRTSG
jgi:hypothetical protein